MAIETLNVINWNACSIKGKQLEFGAFLNSKNIDVALLTETHLKPLRDNIYLPGFHVHRLDRTATGGGGVAVAVKFGTKHRLLPQFHLDLVEAIGVEVETTLGPIVFVAVYYPTQCKTNDGSATKLRNDIMKLTRRHGKYVIGGDLNARHETWGNSRRNRNGVVLNEDLQCGHYNILAPDLPTRVSRTGTRSIIDIFISNIGPSISLPVVHEELSSDHFPVLVEVGAGVENRRVYTRRDYHRVNWEAYKATVDENIDFDRQLVTSEDIDAAVEEVQLAISRAVEANVREVPVTSKSVQIDPTTLKLIQLRNIYRRQYQRTRCPDKKVSYRNLSEIVRARLNAIRNENFSEHVRRLDNHSKPFWRMTKLLKNKPRPIPPFSTPTGPLITPLEKANALGQHFLSSHLLGQNMPSPHDQSVAEEVARIENTPIAADEILQVSPEELRAAVRFSKNMKAPGFDNVFNLELKHLSDRFFAHLALIFTLCFALGYFPSSWKVAKVIAIHKPGKDPTSPKSYRPISLLSALSKLFERVVHGRILSFADANNIFPEQQFGFRKGRSTVHQLTRAVQLIRRNKQVAKTSAMALLDVEKAFDNVWHDGLVSKLRRCGLPLYIVRVIRCYLAGRTFRVSINNTLSDIFNIVAGVPQGSILGPILFNIFTSDLPPLPDGGELFLFADDTAIVYKGRVIRALTAKLQRGLDALAAYFAEWKIRINAAKTQTILFPHSGSHKLIPAADVKIKLEGNTIEWSKVVTYLGLSIDSKLLFREQVDKTVTRCSILLRSLFPLVNRRSRLSLKNKLAVFKSVVCPMIDYAQPVWGSCAKSHRDRLQRIQNKWLKMILNVPFWTRTTEVHQLAGVGTLDARFENQRAKFQRRCAVSDIEVIRNIRL